MNATTALAAIAFVASEQGEAGGLRGGRRPGNVFHGFIPPLLPGLYTPPCSINEGGAYRFTKRSTYT
jgi:hypothetical protein